MKTLLGTLAFLCVMAATARAASEPTRTLGVRAGPEQVFSRSVMEIVAPLQGATATNINGRVGPELVFWGYRLTNGGATNLFACALVAGVDCEARVSRICLTGNAQLQLSVIERGNMVKRECLPVGNAGVGDLYPGCTSNEIQNDLLVGLVSCPGGN